MTPLEIMSAKTTFGQLWPHSRMTDVEWGVVAEKACRIDIGSDQATAALRNLKATTDSPPGVAATLAALRAAEGGQQQAQPQRPTGRQEENWGHRAAEMRDQYGLTSFERRVLDDPKFEAYARKSDLLDADRLKSIMARATAAGYVRGEGMMAGPQTQEPDDDPFF